MSKLLLHECHQNLGGRFITVNGAEAVNDYGDWQAEHAALRAQAGLVDLSFRSRLCVIGGDRIRFLHGQVTNDVKKLKAGEGCYAAVTNAKGKMESDLNIYRLDDELLLDFEPGLTTKILQRLEKYIVADDVQIVDASPHYSLLSIWGPKAEQAILLQEWAGRDAIAPLQSPFAIVKLSTAAHGEVYVAKQARPANRFDLFIPNTTADAVAAQLLGAVNSMGGRACGWRAIETLRIEAGVPRFGVDMDETNIPIECGIEAVSYTKGCYIGQEILNRIHTIGHVNKELRGFRLPAEIDGLPSRGDKLFSSGREVGFITSAVDSPALQMKLALGYVRREVGQIGNHLQLQMASSQHQVKIVPLPFSS